MAPARLPKEIAAVLTSAIQKAAKEPEYVKFVSERSARWEWIPPENVVAKFDSRREVVREIMKKAGILKEPQ
jgi:tripartite-type tricarboxylate transporter receptor subunit TctC